MATAVVMPRLGNTVETCLIIAWTKEKGAKVEKGEIICELETDKAIFEIEAPVSGTLLDIFFEAGTDVPVLTNIAVIGTSGENYSDLIPKENLSSVVEPVKPAIISETSSKKDSSQPEIYSGPATANFSPAGKSGISPRAKMRATKLGVETGSITGSGPGGRIIERDIISASSKQNPLTPAAKVLYKDNLPVPLKGTGIGGRITVNDVQHAIHQNSTGTFAETSIKEVPLKGIRKIIADRMLSSLQNSAQLTLNYNADARNLLELRKNFKKNHENPDVNKITINDLLHYAVVNSLKSNPDLNSHLVEDRIIYHNNIHLGFAVDTPRGLMVPVIKNAQNLNLIGISKEAKRLAAACLEGKINPDELNGATFTVTNLGNFGIETFTPVLNLPQTGILGVGNIGLKPLQTDFGLEFIPHIVLSLTIDHRIIDGATGARFLQAISRSLKEIKLNNSV